MFVTQDFVLHSTNIEALALPFAKQQITVFIRLEGASFLALFPSENPDADALALCSGDRK